MGLLASMVLWVDRPMSHLSLLSPAEWERLNKIIKFAQKIQHEYSIIDQLRLKAPQLKQELLDICRKCTDTDCIENSGCEVKKAYNMLIKAKA